MTAMELTERLERGEAVVVPARYLGTVQTALNMRGGTWEIDIKIEGKRATLTPIVANGKYLTEDNA